jgi:uncharacterized membrane protein YozB (DUF420 family)
VTLDGPGFLQRTSTLGGDVNLIAELVIGIALIFGASLASRGRYGWHGAFQVTALALTVLLTVAWMGPAFRDVYEKRIERGVLTRVNVAVATHVAVGTLTLLLGAWVVLVAGTQVVPPRWRFRNYKAWMRTLLGLWWLSIALGVATYLLTGM